MSVFKKIPVRYRGELHDVRLVNFSVTMNEVAPLVPKNIRIRNFGGRAMISMVDVKLKNMRAVWFPFLRFSYRHVAFRLLVDDSDYTDGTSKGIFFLRSFSDKPVIVMGGKLMTDYNLENASIEENEKGVVVQQGPNVIRYALANDYVPDDNKLTETIGALDRAYSVMDGKTRVTTIQREKWPIQPVACSAFENTFFPTARFEGAFRVNETIYYDWFPPKAIQV